MIKVLIPEDIPSDNKGEAALFLGIAKSLEILDGVEITLFSIHPERDRAVYGGLARIVDSKGITPAHMLDGTGTFRQKLVNYALFIMKNTLFALGYFIAGTSCLRLFSKDLWKSCIGADLVLMCHDSFYAPLYHGPLILLFKALGKPVMLYGSTIVPPRASAGRKEIALRNFLNRLFLGKADMITLRERMSYDYLRSLNLNNTAVYPDLAFLTDTAPDDEVDAVLTDEKIPRDAPLCGFAFSQKEIAFAHPGQPAHERREKALRALAALMDHITCDLGLNAVFIPHAIGPTPRVDDRIAAEWIHERCRRRDRIFIMRKDYSQALLKGIARKLDMTVGTRLHLTIDAVCHGVPSMLITHRGEFRCHGIVGDMLGQADCVYDTEDVKAEDLIRMADVIWDRREHLRKELEARLLGIIENTRMHAVLAQDVYRRSSSRNE